MSLGVTQCVCPGCHSAEKYLRPASNLCGSHTTVSVAPNVSFHRNVPVSEPVTGYRGVPELRARRRFPGTRN